MGEDRVRKICDILGAKDLNSVSPMTRRSILYSLVVVIIAALLMIVPLASRTPAQVASPSSPPPRAT